MSKNHSPTLKRDLGLAFGVIKPIDEEEALRRNVIRTTPIVVTGAVLLGQAALDVRDLLVTEVCDWSTIDPNAVPVGVRPSDNPTDSGMEALLRQAPELYERVNRSEMGSTVLSAVGQEYGQEAKNAPNGSHAVTIDVELDGDVEHESRLFLSGYELYQTDGSDTGLACEPYEPNSLIFRWFDNWGNFVLDQTPEDDVDYADPNIVPLKELTPADLASFSLKGR